MTNKEVFRLGARLRPKEETPFGAEYFKKLQKKYPNDPQHIVLEKVFEEHHQLLNRDKDYIEIAKLVSQELKPQFDVTRIRAGSADKNAQIILEVLNSLMFFHNIESKVLIREAVSTPVYEGRQEVERRIQQQAHEKRARGLTHE